MNRSIMVLERDGDEIRLHYGFEPDLGFSISIVRYGKLQVAYHSIVRDHTGLSGLLDALIDFGIFSRGQVQEAMCALLLAGSADDVDDTDVRQLALIIQELK